MRTLDRTPSGSSIVKPDSIVERILQTVAAYENVPTTELPPLFDVVDPDALAAIFASPSGGPARTEGRVSFPYCGYQLTVSADGSIAADPIVRSNGED